MGRERDVRETKQRERERRGGKIEGERERDKG